MANRRDFLIATGTSAGLAAFSLVGSACAPPPAAPPSGYAVGQRMPTITGRNAFGGTSRSTELRGSWVLVDLCPWWCIPCRSSAEKQTEFVRYLRGAGIALRILAVVVEDSSERPASRFAAPTGATPGCPTYVLLDPAGVIRGYFTTGDLVQDALASLVGFVQVAGRSLAGATIDNTMELDGSGAATGPEVSVFPFLDSYGPLLNSCGTGVLAYSSVDPETGAIQLLQFDPDTPVTLTYRPETPPAGGQFRRAIGTTAELLLDVQLLEQQLTAAAAGV